MRIVIDNVKWAARITRYHALCHATSQATALLAVLLVHAGRRHARSLRRQTRAGEEDAADAQRRRRSGRTGRRPLDGDSASVLMARTRSVLDRVLLDVCR